MIGCGSKKLAQSQFRLGNDKMFAKSASIFLLIVFQGCCYGLETQREKLARNGIFLAPESKLVHEKISTKDAKKSILNRNQEKRQPRLVVLPKDDHKRNSSEQLCTDNYCLELGYDKLSRPWIADGDGDNSPIRVGISIDELRILDIQDDTFSLSAQMYLGVRWIEPRISGPNKTKKNDVQYVEGDDYLYYYDDSDYLSDFDNTSFVALDTKFVRHLWVPDVYVYNMKYGSRTLKDYDGRLFVLNGNEIFYRQELIVTIWCPFRFEFWPLDRQTCTFKLGSFSHKVQEMVFEMDQLRYDFNRANPLLEYVRLTPLSGDDLIHDHHIHKFSVTGFRVDLKRRPFQYIANYYLPASLFVIVSWASFLIPPDVIPGRMTLLITLFLVLVNIFNSVNQKAPRVERINSMAVYIIVCLLFVFGALAVYTVILYLKKRANAKINSRMGRTGSSLWFAYLFPAEQLTIENRNVHRKSVSSQSTDVSDEDGISVNPAGREDTSPPMFGNTLHPNDARLVLPPPPPPMPKMPAEASNGFVRRNTSFNRAPNGKRQSLATVSGLIAPPAPRDARAGWHDKDTDLADKIFIVVFPVLFIVFNGLYWPFLFNEGVLFKA